MTATWLTEGLITAVQRERILSWERNTTSVTRPAGSAARLDEAQPVGHPGPGPAVEALGYIGGVVVVVAALVFGFQVWDDLGTVTQLSLVGGAAAVLLVAGAAVRPSAGEVGVRMRSVLWLAATATTCGFLALLGADVLGVDDSRIGSFTTVGATVVAAMFWLVHRSVVQQVAAMGCAVGAAASVVAAFSASRTLPGLGAWCVGVVWAILAWGGVLAYRRVGLTLGAVAALVGAMITVPNDAGMVLALVTALSVVGVAVWFRDLVLMAVGVLGALNALLAAVSTWWPETLAAPLILLVVGLALVVTAVHVARRRGEPQSVRPDRSRGTTRAAWLLAAPVLAMLTSVLVTSVLV